MKLTFINKYVFIVIVELYFFNSVQALHHHRDFNSASSPADCQRSTSLTKGNFRGAARFYLSVKQACGMLENILAGFRQGIFSKTPQVEEGFMRINKLFEDYPHVTKLSKEQLFNLKSYVVVYQAFLAHFSEKNRLHFTEQEASFMLSLNRFNEFLVANILHEHYLPFMEDYSNGMLPFFGYSLAHIFAFFSLAVGVTLAGSYILSASAR